MRLDPPRLVTSSLTQRYYIVTHGTVDGEKLVADSKYDVTQEVTKLIAKTIAATLRYSASDPLTDKQADDVGNQLEKGTPEEWDCCPLCQEVVCDGHCPLHDVRKALSPVSFP
jgi:hypothetical protein